MAVCGAKIRASRPGNCGFCPASALRAAQRPLWVVDQAFPSEAGLPDKLNSVPSSTLAKKPAAHENDQLLEKALDEPVQQKRADLALQARLRTSYENCVKNSADATPALLDCNAEEYRYQDARLNKLYRERLVGLDKPQQSGLREKQRKWIKFRDKLCDFDGSLGAG
jgi:uncharacterized protein YecT (DUF1311 family)